MGGSSSSEKNESTGNTGIVSVGGTPNNNVWDIGVSTGGMFVFSAPETRSTVANATAKNLRIFYHKEKVKLEDLLAKADSTKRVFKPKAGISFIELQSKQQLVAPSLEEGFASVLVADPEDAEVYVETICLNFQVPDGACCIVTAKNELKFRKNDGGVWIDEDGHDHST